MSAGSTPGGSVAYPFYITFEQSVQKRLVSFKEPSTEQSKNDGPIVHHIDC